MLEKEAKTFWGIVKPQFHALTWLGDWSIKWPCASNAAPGCTHSLHKKMCLAPSCSKREQQQQSAQATSENILLLNRRLLARWPLGSQPLLAHPNPALLCGPASRARAEKGILRTSIDQQEEQGLKRHIWIIVDESAWTNQLHSFKGQVINSVLFQEQAGKHSTKMLISKMSPWLPAMLQGLFFLQGSFGKLINLGKGIHFQDENFACNFFFFLTLAKKNQLSEKKMYGKKMSVGSIKNCWNSS